MRRQDSLYACYKDPAILSGNLNMNEWKNQNFKGAWGFPVADRLLQNITNHEIRFDAIVSVPTGGDFWAQKLVQLTQRVHGHSVPLYRVHKEWKHEFSIIDGQPLPQDGRLLVVDDTFYSGKTAKRLCQFMVENGFTIAGVATLVELQGEGGGARKHWNDGDPPVISVFNEKFLKKNGYPKKLAA
tara:strand:+ start:2283 stop:2837 length:555 start_codon:yes stop_codon:yes gene_type:complete